MDVEEIYIRSLVVNERKKRLATSMKKLKSKATASIAMTKFLNLKKSSPLTMADIVKAQIKKGMARV